ncbi:MAG TPA: RNA polymerase sigma factor [Bacteroidales bacterium]|nr:RNA polymerase sigma factor [Bacteroidales bacterium]
MTRNDFNNFVQQLSRKLYGYAFRILRNQEDAEDAVQEIFVKLWNMGDKLDKYKSVDALAITMTKNYCIDQLRKHKNIYHEENRRQDYKYFASPSPHEQMEIRESNEIIHNIIDRLPEGSGDIIRLRDIEGFSYEEIAEKTGQNINTLRVTISRARRIIRDEFNKYQYEHRGIEPIARKVL